MRTKLICEKADPHENHARERRRPVPQRAGRHIGRGLGVSVSGLGLDGLKLRTPALVTGLVPARDGREHSTCTAFAGIGFVPGETVQVLARGAWGATLWLCGWGTPRLRCGTKRRPWCRFRRRGQSWRGTALNAGGVSPKADFLRVALLGNPNCGKTALFNLLTGARQKVANYAV